MSTRRSLCAAYCASSLLAIISLDALSTLSQLTTAYYLLLVLRAYLAVACPPCFTSQFTATLLYLLRPEERRPRKKQF